MIGFAAVTNFSIRGHKPPLHSVSRGAAKGGDMTLEKRYLKEQRCRVPFYLGR